MARVDVGNTAGWDKLMKQLSKLELNADVKVGVFGDSAGTDGFNRVALAAAHEYGSVAAHLPERSFIRSTLRNEEGRLEKVYGVVLKGLIAGTEDPTKALDKIGLWATNEIKLAISSDKITPSSNKPGGTTLVDTGALLNSVTWKVEK